LNETNEPAVEEPVTEPAPPFETPAAVRFPWPPTPDENVIYAAAETWRQSLFTPVAFFRAMPPAGYKSALAYALPIGVIAAAIRLFWTSLFDLAGLQSFNVLEPADSGPADRIIDFLLSPLFLVATMLLFGAVTHGALLLVRGANRPFVTTMRVLAFSYGPALFGIVPFLGTLVGFIWMQVLLFFGLREAHQTSNGRVLLALLLPVLVLMFLLMLVAIVLVVVMGVTFSSLQR